jgi:hypothetical protein
MIKFEFAHCGNSYASTDSRNTHQTTCPQNPAPEVIKFECAHCGKSCSSTNNRNTHQKTCPQNPAPEVIECAHCGKSFTKTSNRNAHQKYCQKNPAPEVIKCAHCGNSYVSTHSRNTHQKTCEEKQALAAAKLNETQKQAAWSVLEALIGGSQWDFVKTIGKRYLSLRIIKSLTSVLQSTPEIGVNHKDVQDALGKFSLFDESQTSQVTTALRAIRDSNTSLVQLQIVEGLTGPSLAAAKLVQENTAFKVLTGDDDTCGVPDFAGGLASNFGAAEYLQYGLTNRTEFKECRSQLEEALGVEVQTTHAFTLQAFENHI